ncbi:hypothetical protein KAU11_02150 [Candidatus Babeliales bacterium]|nr:hypothetical protein [Candidatus Babeliales bacterium]
MKNPFSFYKIFGQLLRVDLSISMDGFIGKYLDIAIWITLAAFAGAYVFPALGMSSGYAAIMATAAIVSNATFDLFDGGASLVADYDGERTITYPLTLSIPGWLLFVKFAFGRALYLMALSLIVLPLNKLVLMEKLSFAEFNIFKFVVIYITMHICAGFLSVWASSMPSVGDFSGILRLWRRNLFPLWWLGGAVFPYFAIASAFPKLSKLFLLNPFLWANEALRGAVLGTQTPTLPFWPLVGALWLTIFILGWWGISRLQKRLDFV